MNIEYFDKYVKVQPYWQTPFYEWSFANLVTRVDTRDRLVKQYSWAIPNHEALEVLARYQPLVEIGAGTGYWAYELRRRNVMIHAYDVAPPSEESEENKYHYGHRTWTEVRQGTPDVLKKYPPDWNLFLCWPPYQDDMAMYSLGYHRGEYICLIGEDDGGCTANRTFFKLLSRFYEEVEECSIPQWDAIHDYLCVYKKK